MTNFIEETKKSFAELREAEKAFPMSIVNWTIEDWELHFIKLMEQTLLQHRVSVIEEVKGVMGEEIDEESSVICPRLRNQYRQETLDNLDKMV